AELDDRAARDDVEIPALRRLEADARAVENGRAKALYLVHDCQIVARVGDATLARQDGVRVNPLDVDSLGPLEGVREVLHLAAPGRVALQVFLASEREVSTMLSAGRLGRELVVEEAEHVENNRPKPSERSGVDLGGRGSKALEDTFFERV